MTLSCKNKNVHNRMSSWQSLTVQSRTRTRNSLILSQFLWHLCGRELPPNKPHQTCEDKTAGELWEEPNDMMYSRCGFCPPLLEMKGATCRCCRAVREMLGKLEDWTGDSSTSTDLSFTLHSQVDSFASWIWARAARREKSRTWIYINPNYYMWHDSDYSYSIHHRVFRKMC